MAGDPMMDRLLAALIAWQRAPEDADARTEMEARLQAIVDARVTLELRAAGVARTVGGEDEERRTARGLDD